LIENIQKLVELDRLGQECIHARLGALLAKAVQDVSCEGNDRHVASGVQFALPNFSCRLETVHFWHLHVHQDDVDSFLFEQSERLFSISRNQTV
jgi:hypothetical protein